MFFDAVGTNEPLQQRARHFFKAAKQIGVTLDPNLLERETKLIK